MTQSSVLERFKGKGAQLVPAAHVPVVPSSSSICSAGVLDSPRNASTGQNSRRLFPQCHRDEAGGDNSAEEEDKCSHTWGMRLDFRFIGEEKGSSTMSHQTSLSQVQQHQFSQAWGQSHTRSHGMILPSEPQLPPLASLLIFSHLQKY